MTNYADHIDQHEYRIFRQALNRFKPIDLSMFVRFYKSTTSEPIGLFKQVIYTIVLCEE